MTTPSRPPSTIAEPELLSWVKREIPRHKGSVALVQLVAKRELGLEAAEVDLVASAAGFGRDGGRYVDFSISPEPPAPRAPRIASAPPVPATLAQAIPSPAPAPRPAPPAVTLRTRYDSRTLRARISSIACSPEAHGREAMAIELVGADCTVDSALLTLRASARDPSSRPPTIDTSGIYERLNAAHETPAKGGA